MLCLTNSLTTPACTASLALQQMLLTSNTDQKATHHSTSQVTSQAMSNAAPANYIIIAPAKQPAKQYPTSHLPSAGVTHALAAIFSFGQRQQLLPFASQMWAEAAKLLDSRTAASSVVARKFAIKLVQRIGLTFLPTTVASWRYQQTSIDINDSLKNVTSSTAQPASAKGSQIAGGVNANQPASTNGSQTAGGVNANQPAPTNGSQTGGVNPDQSADKPDAANQQYNGCGEAEQVAGVHRAALQPSQFVNVSGPQSPAKSANTQQAMHQAEDVAAARHDSHGPTREAHGPAAGPEAESEDIDVPEEIEEVRLAFPAHDACLYNTRHHCTVRQAHAFRLLSMPPRSAVSGVCEHKVDLVVTTYLFAAYQVSCMLCICTPNL